MNRKVLSLLTASGAALLLAACAVGPKAPDPTIPAQGQGAFIGSQSASVSTEAARADWWRLYNDATLDGLIQQALTENNELEAAAANLRAVRASLSEARAGRLPTTNASAGFTRSRASTITNPAANGATLDDVDTYTTGLDVSYEVDLFGRVESTVRAARSDAAAAAEALEVVRITVAAETARVLLEGILEASWEPSLRCLQKCFEMASWRPAGEHFPRCIQKCSEMASWWPPWAHFPRCLQKCSEILS